LAAQVLSSAARDVGAVDAVRRQARVYRA
jgi:hypothetical protein